MCSHQHILERAIFGILFVAENTKDLDYFYKFEEKGSSFIYTEMRPMGSAWSFTATKNQCNKRANMWCIVNESHDKVASKVMCEALSFMFYHMHDPEIVIAELESNIETEIESTAPGFWKIESSKKDVYPQNDS